MDLSAQQGNGELVNTAKMGVIRPSQLGKFAHLRVLQGQTKLQKGAPEKILPPKWCPGLQWVRQQERGCCKGGP